VCRREGEGEDDWLAIIDPRRSIVDQGGDFHGPYEPAVWWRWRHGLWVQGLHADLYKVLD
jgi:hypothetical protein